MSKKEIVCFAGCDWWYHNRGLFCPQIMSRLATEYRILYVNSLGMRVPSLKKGKSTFLKVNRKLKSFLKYLKNVSPNFYVYSPVSVPLSADNIFFQLNEAALLGQIKLIQNYLGFNYPIYYLGCPPAWEVVKKLSPVKTIYERTDIFPEMPGVDREHIARVDEHLYKTSDLVLYVNREMYNGGNTHNSGSIYIGHGVDYDFFASAEEKNYQPEDIREIPKPIAGFFGEISTKTSDFDLLEQCLESLPHISFVMVGPISADISRFLPYEKYLFPWPEAIRRNTRLWQLF